MRLLIRVLDVSIIIFTGYKGRRWNDHEMRSNIHLAHGTIAMLQKEKLHRSPLRSATPFDIPSKSRSRREMSLLPSDEEGKAPRGGFCCHHHRQSCCLR